MTARDEAASGRHQSLHVLTLTPFYPNEKDEAQGCFIAEPIQALSDLGIVNTVFALQPIYRKRVSALQTNARAEWHRYFSFPKGLGLSTAGAFAFASIVGRVRALQREHPIDLIHAHAPLPAGHAAMLLSSELGLPYVVSVHGLDVLSTVQVAGRSGKWCARIARRVYERSQRVICISEAVRKRVLEEMGSGCRTSVVYNGVDPELFSPPESTGASDLTILSVGNLIPIKGHHVLLRAVAAVAPEFPSIRLEIIGEGPERRRLDQLARELGISHQVQFLGRRTRQEVANAMRRSTVFVLPSSYEGLGCVYLEAMSCAKPVIGCRGQGIAEVVRQALNGFLVGPGNDKELALVLGMLLRDERKRDSIGMTARDTILDRFTLAQQAQNLARIYRECAL